MSAAAGSRTAPPLEAAQWRQLAWITVGAIAIYLALRLLPTGTNLSHMDFRVDPRGGNAIEFCDPTNPQFIPVVAVRSPVVMTIGPPAGARSHAANGAASAGGWIVAGSEAQCVVTLKTGTGKPVAQEDLLYTHTRRLHLLLVDPTLSDYQHVHPQPARTAGEWAFSFTPQRTGTYRVFADFMPAATGRGLYASADLEVGATRGDARPDGHGQPASLRDTVEIDGVRFTLAAAQKPVRAAQPIDLRFAMERSDGAAIALEPVMDALAHLVAFDMARSGFAHLHPAGVEMPEAADATRHVLNFKLTIPRAGPYVVWAQVNIGGRETFVPFALDVVSAAGGKQD